MGRSSTHQLVVLQEGENNWEIKILEPFSITILGKLAVDKDWLAVPVYDESRPAILKVKLWKEELFRQDIELPGVHAYDVKDVVLESPFLVVSSHDFLNGASINVFHLPADRLLEAPWIKTIQFPGFHAEKLFCNGFVFGCFLRPFPGSIHERSVVLFENTELLDVATWPEQTNENRTFLPHLTHDENHINYFVDMNASCLIFIEKGPDGANQHNFLCKKDFWMCGNTVS